MYLHIGNNTFLRKKNIVGIFDIDKTTTSSITKKVLSDCEKKKKLFSINDRIPRSFILMNNSDIYMSQISPQSLYVRAEQNDI